MLNTEADRTFSHSPLELFMLILIHFKEEYKHKYTQYQVESQTEKNINSQ